MGTPDGQCLPLDLPGSLTIIGSPVCPQFGDAGDPVEEVEALTTEPWEDAESLGQHPTWAGLVHCLKSTW